MTPNPIHCSQMVPTLTVDFSRCPGVALGLQPIPKPLME